MILLIAALSLVPDKRPDGMLTNASASKEAVAALEKYVGCLNGEIVSSKKVSGSLSEIRATTTEKCFRQKVEAVDAWQKEYKLNCSVVCLNGTPTDFDSLFFGINYVEAFERDLEWKIVNFRKGRWKVDNDREQLGQ